MTHTTKHTPGPWLIAKNGQAGATFHIWRNDAAGKGQGNEGYAHIVKHVHGEANANLIAAAPAMYEALQDIVEGLTDEITHMIEGSKPDTARLDYLANKAGLALAQAEGR